MKGKWINKVKERFEWCRPDYMELFNPKTNKVVTVDIVDTKVVDGKRMFLTTGGDWIDRKGQA